MAAVTSLESFTVPLGGQGVELQEVVHAAGGMALLRVRIREGKRFTVFDIDPETARRWAALGHTERSRVALGHLARVHPQLARPGEVVYYYGDPLR